MNDCIVGEFTSIENRLISTMHNLPESMSLFG